jgi:hypothetical protein
MTMTAGFSEISEVTAWAPALVLQLGSRTIELDAVGLKLLLQPGEPALGEIEVHRNRNEGDRLAFERFLEGNSLERLVEPLLRQRGRGHRRADRQADSAKSRASSIWISSCFPPD